MKNILLLLLILEMGCRLKEEKEKKEIAIVDTPKQEFWISYEKKMFIPKVLIDKLNQLSDGNFQILDYNDHFPSIDEIRKKNQVSRKFRFLGNWQNLWILTYKHQTDTLHYHYIACEIVDNTLKSFSAGVSNVSLDAEHQINNALSTKQIRFKNLDSKDEKDKL